MRFSGIWINLWPNTTIYFLPIYILFNFSNKVKNCNWNYLQKLIVDLENFYVKQYSHSYQLPECVCPPWKAHGCKHSLPAQVDTIAKPHAWRFVGKEMSNVLLVRPKQPLDPHSLGWSCGYSRKSVDLYISVKRISRV